MTTYRHIVDELHESLEQTIDDPKLTKSHVAYWVIMMGNRLKMQHISKRDSGAYLHIFPNVPVESHSANSEDEVKGRKYILLPRQVYDYDLDKGVSYISYYLEDDIPECPPRFTHQTFYRTTPAKAARTYYNPYEAPRPSHPFFYRNSDHIYFLGLEKVPVKTVEIGIYSTIPPVTDINLDDPIDFPEELIAVLQRQVLDLGRFSMMLPQDLVNEGRNNLGNANVPEQKITSVNDISSEEGEQSNES